MSQSGLCVQRDPIDGRSLRRQKEAYDRNVVGPELAPGDRVRYQNFRVDATLDRSFQKKYSNTIYHISERLSAQNYKIVDADGNSKIVHYNQLKKVPAVGGPAEGENDEPGTSGEPTRRSSRQRGQPAHLRDYDLSWGPNVG